MVLIEKRKKLAIRFSSWTNFNLFQRLFAWLVTLDELQWFASQFFVQILYSDKFFGEWIIKLGKHHFCAYQIQFRCVKEINGKGWVSNPCTENILNITSTPSLLGQPVSPEVNFFVKWIKPIKN